MADVETFLEELTQALAATRDAPERFDRFATAVLGADRTVDSTAVLRDQLASVAAFRAGYDARNHSELKYGFARLDAFGRIMNELLVRHIGVDDPAQSQPPNAPVSYPFLWDTPTTTSFNGMRSPETRIAGSRTLGGSRGTSAKFSGCSARSRSGRQRRGTTGVRLIRSGSRSRACRRPCPGAQVPEMARRVSGHRGTQAGGRAGLFVRYSADCPKSINRDDPGRTVNAVRTPTTSPPNRRSVSAPATRRGSAGSTPG